MSRAQADADAAALNKAAPRFMEKTVERGDCLIWTASDDGKGYGQFWFDGKLMRAHRFAWLLVHGSLPDGELDHMCSNRACVNVAHLEPVSHVENVRRTQQRGKRYSVPNCPKCGQPKTSEKWGLACLPCNRERARVWHQERRTLQTH